MVTKKEQTVLPVSDRPAEVWIKLLFFITAIAVAMVGYIGDRLIKGQDRTTEAVSKINGSLSTFDHRISENAKDIEETNVKVDGNTQEINKLKGAIGNGK